MIVDSSAIIAILKDEPEAEGLLDALEESEACRISAANFFEAAIVMDSARNPIASRDFDNFVERAGIVIEPVTPEQARVAREAYRDFGKGQHKAGLNFGDCFAYALAKTTGEALLFKGNDFTHTDVTPAVPHHGRRR